MSESPDPNPKLDELVRIVRLPVTTETIEREIRAVLLRCERWFHRWQVP